MILIDTTPLVTLCDDRDRRHRTAIKRLAAMPAAQFGTCEAVLAEARFHLPHSIQRRRLRAMIERLRIAAVPAALDQSLWLEVLAWLVKYADHEPDWADGYLSVLCGRDERLRVWTYDREFRTTWRTPNGAAIPLAIK